MTFRHDYKHLALVASEGARAQRAAQELADVEDWVPIEEADAVVVLGGDGFMLHTLHQMLDSGRMLPAFGMNRGTVGFLMNRFDTSSDLRTRINMCRSFSVSPLLMDATTQDGRSHTFRAINEVSLLRETRQTAKIEVTVNGKVRIEELFCDGILLATPAGSTAYNLSANGPILPLDSKMLALTPISPFRPRRWRGAILPDFSQIELHVLEPAKRPVAVVADQKELRDIAHVHLRIDPETTLTLLFDPGHSLDERIVTEQFIA